MTNNFDFTLSQKREIFGFYLKKFVRPFNRLRDHKLKY